jgi:V8-like Glu-specific endopeptidase
MVRRRIVGIVAAVSVGLAASVTLTSAVQAASANKTRNTDNISAPARLSDGRLVNSPEAQREVMEFWTPERMRAAKPMEAPPSSDSNRSHRKPSDTPGEIPPALPSPDALNQHKPAPVGTQATYASRSVGKVFFKMPHTGNGLWECSASSIASPKRKLVMTAGHCVHSGPDHPNAWATEWIFVPLYTNGSRPHGSFAATNLTSKTGWTEDGDSEWDMGMAIMATNEHGRLIVDEVGGNGSRWNYPEEVDVTALGYPSNRDNGEVQWLCWGRTESTSGDFIQLGCGWDTGASGSPLLQEYQDKSDGYGLGYINGVIITLRTDGTNQSPYFDTDGFKSLYDYTEGLA